MANNENFHISYLTLRKLLGALGFLLPVILVVGAAIASDTRALQPSISHYYHTAMRDVFVCILTSFGLFLFTYDYKSRDKWLTNLAGVFALSVAFFPTSTGECEAIGCRIHFISAALFFLVLAYISFFLFTKSRHAVVASRTKQKNQRNIIYRVCALIMLLCLILLALYFFLFEEQWPKTTAFWLETLALWAFGISWLVKGETILKDDDTSNKRKD